MAARPSVRPVRPPPEIAAIFFGAALVALAVALLGSSGSLLFALGSLFGVIASVAMLATGFGLWRVYTAEPVPSEDQSAFQSIPRTSAIALATEEERIE